MVNSGGPSFLVPVTGRGVTSSAEAFPCTSISTYSMLSSRGMKARMAETVTPGPDTAGTSVDIVYIVYLEFFWSSMCVTVVIAISAVHIDRSIVRSLNRRVEFLYCTYGARGTTHQEPSGVKSNERHALKTKMQPSRRYRVQRRQ